MLLQTGHHFVLMLLQIEFMFLEHLFFQLEFVLLSSEHLLIVGFSLAGYVRDCLRLVPLPTVLVVGRCEWLLQLVEHAHLYCISDQPNRAFSLLFVVLLANTGYPWVQACLLESFSISKNKVIRQSDRLPHLERLLINEEQSACFQTIFS